MLFALEVSTGSIRRCSSYSPSGADPATFGDYRPISLIHLVAKLFAKMLSLRLAPKLDNLISKNQNSFIPSRNLHHNLSSHGNPACYTSFESPGCY
jgi:hypothetical protein